jgi:hypothetical protein
VTGFLRTTAAKPTLSQRFSALRWTRAPAVVGRKLLVLGIVDAARLDSAQHRTSTGLQQLQAVLVECARIGQVLATPLSKSPAPNGQNRFGAAAQLRDGLRLGCELEQQLVVVLP